MSLYAGKFLFDYFSTQIKNFFPNIARKQTIKINSFNRAIERTNHCISKIKAANGKEFNYLNSGHYATFLFFLSREVWVNDGDEFNATRIFLLNKALNGIDLHYEVEMADVFLIGHTVGMVFAKASYQDFCIFHQGCTVGRNLNSRPTLDRGIIMYPHSSIIGSCRVRENTVLAPGVQLINRDTPGNCLVFTGSDGDLIFKPTMEYYPHRYFVS